MSCSGMITAEVVAEVVGTVVVVEVAPVAWVCRGSGAVVRVVTVVQMMVPVVFGSAGDSLSPG